MGISWESWMSLQLSPSTKEIHKTLKLLLFSLISDKICASMATKELYINILFMFAFDLRRALKTLSSQAHYSFGCFLHQWMRNTKHKHLCFCQSLAQGSSNRNQDFWQTCTGMSEGEKGERCSFSAVPLNLSPSQFITGQLRYMSVLACAQS